MEKSTSAFLNNIVLVIGFGALIGAAWVGYSALVVVVGLALAVALVTKTWSRLCLKGVTCERRLSELRVFPGDEALLTLRVVNRKILPLPWIEVRDEMPARLADPTTGPVDPAEPAGNAARPTVLGSPVEAAERPGFVALSRSTPLPWYSAATFTHRLNCSTRGYYPLGPLSVTSGDIFGIHPRSRTQSEIDHLIVYPRTYELAELGIPSLFHLGDTQSEVPVFDDPSRLMGIREYAPGDNPRRIHWKVSARSSALQVKLFEFTTDLKVTIFLALDSFANQSEDDLELGISTAASVARHLLERDVQTGFSANTRLADTGGSACIAAGTGTAHLTIILEALAKTTADPDGSFIDFFERERGELGFGGTLVFVAGEVFPALEVLMSDLARADKRVLGFCVGANGLSARTAGVHWHHVRSSGTPEQASGLADSAIPTEEATRREGAVA